MSNDAGYWLHVVRFSKLPSTPERIYFRATALDAAIDRFYEEVEQLKSAGHFMITLFKEGIHGASAEVISLKYLP
jgi:truncated hemoglobin YjbI